MSPLAGVATVLFSGAAADSRDRRAILLAAKILLTGSVAFLVVVSSTGLLTPTTLLVGLAGTGVSNGMSSPSWWTTIAGLVPAELAPVAFSLDSFQWNIGQVVGPILGGAVLRGAGTTVFFVLCGTVMMPQVGFLLLWRGRTDLRLSTRGSAAESLFGAVSSGWRYFSNTPGLRAIAVRTAVYVTPAAALGALLPLFAARYLHITAFGYGLVLAVSGVGPWSPRSCSPACRAGSTSTPSSRSRRSPTTLGVAALVTWPTRWAVVPVLVVTGASWVWATVALVIAARQVTPEWVQTRSMSLFYVVLQGPFVLGGIGVGVIDTFLSLARHPTCCGPCFRARHPPDPPVWAARHRPLLPAAGDEPVARHRRARPS